VIGSVNGSQRQSNLREALLFYLNHWLPATSFAFVVLREISDYFCVDSRLRRIRGAWTIWGVGGTQEGVKHNPVISKDLADQAA